MRVQVLSVKVLSGVPKQASIQKLASHYYDIKVEFQQFRNDFEKDIEGFKELLIYAKRNFEGMVCRQNHYGCSNAKIDKEDVAVPVDGHIPLAPPRFDISADEGSVTPVGKVYGKPSSSICFGAQIGCMVKLDSQVACGASLSDDDIEYSPELLKYVDETVKQFKALVERESVENLFASGVKCVSPKSTDSFIYLPCLDIPESVDVDALNDWLNGSKVYGRKRKLMNVSNDIPLPMMVGPVKVSKSNGGISYLMWVSHLMNWRCAAIFRIMKRQKGPVELAQMSLYALGRLLDFGHK